MSLFDEDTSTMRARRAGSLIDLLKPEYKRQTKARGIANGVLFGVLMWAAIIALGIALWRWMH